jgi:ArsR family transcriptional regulator, lead/cadmium/zinc/bismuth-responsive transcriptional repressor
LEIEKKNDFIRLFKALANEDRLKIMNLLKKNGKMIPQQLQKHFFLEQSTTSHHLNTLKNAGITKSQKLGRNIYYSLDYETMAKHIKDFLHLFK